MTPGEFYQKEFTGIGLKNPSKRKYIGNINSLPHKFWNGVLPLADFNTIVPPSENTIINAHLLQIKKNFPVDLELTSQVNYIAEGKNEIWQWGEKEFSMEDMLEIFEAAFTTSFGGDKKNLDVITALSNKFKSSFNEKGYFPSYEKALERLGAVLELLNTDNDFISEDKMKAYLNQLSDAYKMLKRDVDANKNNITVRGSSKDYFGNNWRSQQSKKIKAGKKKKAVKYDEEIIALGNQLKGRWFERQVMNFLSNVIYPDGIIIDTANVNIETIDLFGKGTGSYKTSRTDFLAVNGLSQYIQIVYAKPGETKSEPRSLLEFFEDCNEASKNGQTISVSAEEWERITSFQGVSGYQAKSGKKQNIVNEYNAYAEDAFKRAGGIWPIFWKKMLDWYSYHNIYANHAYYDAIFNLGIAHSLTYIIGVGNNYLALRGRIVPTRQYLEEQLASKKYFRAGKPVDLNKPGEKIPVILSSEPASYGNGKK